MLVALASPREKSLQQLYSISRRKLVVKKILKIVYNHFMENNQTILIVEDDIFAQEFLYQTLKKLGFYNILTTTNAKDAMNFCKNNDIDLVFMDININGAMDGVQCAREISFYHTVPIVFTTAYSDTHTIDEASETNLYGYLIKPFTEQDISIILKVIKKQIFSKNKISNKTSLGKNSFYDFNTKSLHINHKKITLTKNETSILEVLIKQQGQPVSYELLRTTIWKKDISDSGIRDAFARLRKKVPTLALTNHFGSGYSLDIT